MTQAEPDDQELLAAEYVLGTLDAEERARARALVAMDPGFAAIVRAWERRLGELNVLVAAVEPPPDIWDRIKAGIAAPGEGIGIYPMVADYNSVDRYRRFAADLQKRGWSEARLEKLMGGNFLRVYRDAWGG